MNKEFQDKKCWALILGGSTGLGLATAKKLAKHGMNICVVHRNSRMQEDQIQAEFKTIKQEGVAFKSFNTDAFKPEKREVVIEALKAEFGIEHKIRTLVHSVAKGNLKPMVSDDKPVLNHDDFALTINAMGISLYDWAKALFEAELFAKDALQREESAGGHFRDEYQTAEGEAMRRKEFQYVSAWEYKGEPKDAVLHKEELHYEDIEVKERSYK